MCRVCRSEGSPEKPLFHPCVCAGSIKYIHQDCLVQWLKYSKKEYCELCKHRYIFTPIYAPDMPKRLPIRDLVVGLLRGILRAVRYWLHYTLVALAWLGIVPLTALEVQCVLLLESSGTMQLCDVAVEECRIYRCLFSGSFSSVLTLPLDLLSTDNIVSDCFQGCFIVTCTLCTFISLVWLREQILHGGGPDWLDQEPALANHRQNDAGVGNNAGVGGNNGQQEHGDDDVVADDVDADDDADDHDNNENNAAGQDDVNWNPMDWDRAAEELTWERLLGLDGSLLFMEHVFWVVSLNTLFIMVFAEALQQSPLGKDKDPRKFAHFRLHCLHCGAAEHSFGNCKFHIRHECTQRNNVYILCGCCGAVFNTTLSLSDHLNVIGVHHRFSSIPGYSPDTLFLPPESSTVPTQIQSVLSSQSSASRPVPIYSTPPASTSTVITLLDSSAINAAASSVPASTSSVVPTSSTSSLSSDIGADFARENAQLYTQLNLRTLQLIWLASWLVRFPPVSTPPPDGVDRMFRQIFVSSWPTDLADAVNMPLHNLLQRLLTYYASLVSQPPIS